MCVIYHTMICLTSHSAVQVDLYQEFFDEDTELILPQAGAYRGPTDIKEYVSVGVSRRVSAAR